MNGLNLYPLTFNLSRFVIVGGMNKPYNLIDDPDYRANVGIMLVNKNHQILAGDLPDIHLILTYIYRIQSRWSPVVPETLHVPHYSIIWPMLTDVMVFGCFDDYHWKTCSNKWKKTIGGDHVFWTIHFVTYITNKLPRCVKFMKQHETVCFEYQVSIFVQTKKCSNHCFG